MSQSLLGSLRALVEALVGDRVDALAAYPATVVLQHEDGTLDVTPDSRRLPEMTHVPIRYGAPGVRANVRPGSRVLIEFAGGQRTSPIATVWEAASVSRVTIAADTIRLADGDRPIAREGDPVVVILTSATLAALAAGAPSAPVTGYILTGSQQSRTA